MGIMGAMTTLGPSLSVIVAGVLLAAFSWHMLMAVFAVLSACLLYTSHSSVPGAPAPAQPRAVNDPWRGL